MSWMARRCAVIAFSLLAACDPGGKAYEDVRLVRLKEGQSTEQDIIKLFGRPTAVRDVGTGKGLVYPLAPEGPYTLLIKLDAAGRYQGRENLLTRANFDRVNTGMKQTDVLTLLGPPTLTQPIALKREVAWIWRFADGGQTRAFVVTFDQAGRMVSTAVEADPRASGGS
jgi:outer membrane protein assembly factor BamE (lipoprotein component of BamABCDE complex)